MSDKEIYHVKLQGMLIFRLKDRFSHHGIFDTHIESDGINFYLKNQKEFQIAKSIVKEYGLTLEKGVLPSIKYAIQKHFFISKRSLID